MSDNERRLNTITQEKEISNRLTLYPIAIEGLILLNNNFWTVLECEIRCGQELINIPSSCACRSKINIQHGMFAKRVDLY